MSNKHNRYLGNSGQRFANYMHHIKSLPTPKQRDFYKDLCIQCREMNLPVTHPADDTRFDYAVAISSMVEALKSIGIVKVRDNPKFKYVAECTRSLNTLIDYDVKSKIVPDNDISEE